MEEKHSKKSKPACLILFLWIYDYPEKTGLSLPKKLKKNTLTLILLFLPATISPSIKRRQKKVGQSIFFFLYERRLFMASDFQILMHRNSDNLHLKLAGHFDAAAAQELFTFIKAYGGGAGSIFIHTSTIKQIHP